MTIAAAAPPVSRGSLFRAAVVLVPALLLCGGLVARLAGSTTSNAWYQSLTLPALQPPGPAFGIAWSILYTLLGLAAALVWATPAAGRGRALALFTLGFAINLSWSPLFFTAHLVAVALGVILVMEALAILTTFAFARVNRLAAWLMLPYMLWLGFAASLNAHILLLNPMADAMQIGI
jgi:benzodiazapine receptor